MFYKNHKFNAFFYVSNSKFIFISEHTIHDSFYRKIKREGGHCRSNFGKSGLPTVSRVISCVLDLAVYEAKEASKR